MNFLFFEEYRSVYSSIVDSRALWEMHINKEERHYTTNVPWVTIENASKRGKYLNNI